MTGVLSCPTTTSLPPPPNSLRNAYIFNFSEPILFASSSPRYIFCVFSTSSPPSEPDLPTMVGRVSGFTSAPLWTEVG